jgi:hypothetical protein
VNFRSPEKRDKGGKGASIDMRQATHELLKREPGPQVQCNKLLFRAERPLSDGQVPEAVSLSELDSLCIFGLLDRRELESMAVEATRRILFKWKRGTISGSKRYTVDGRTFVLAYGSGYLPTAPRETLEYLALVVTNIDGHVICWVMQSPNPDSLTALESNTFQIGDGKENSLIPTEIVGVP